VENALFLSPPLRCINHFTAFPALPFAPFSCTTFSSQERSCVSTPGGWRSYFFGEQKMSNFSTLTVQPRDRAGKGAARAARREGLLPGVIYGNKQAPVMFNMDPRDLIAEMQKAGFSTRLFEIKLDGATHVCLCQDVQFHPVTDAFIHVDFLRVDANADVTVEVPVHFLNDEKSVGLKKGGVLNIVRHTIEVVAPASNIPEFFEVDLAAVDVNETIHISNVTLPEGVTPTITDRDFTVCTIAAPSGGVAKDEDGAEGEA
jgi:large subunit ribosomal protein L25